MTVNKFKRKLESQNKDAMVAVHSAVYGFIWYGKVKFMYSHFRNEFFNKKIVCMEQRLTHISITI